MKTKVKLLFTGVVVLLLLAGVTRVALAASRAAFTAVNEDVDGPGHCLNGKPDPINCNLYDGKDFVWLNAGPIGASFGDGAYFFAVLSPGGQADPNDGSDKNLSSPNDDYTNRTFSVSGGIVSYSGLLHDFDVLSYKIRLMPYNDTSNPGGVYILAICSLADGYPVAASSCKYDAFKVKQEVEIPSDLVVVKDANPSFTRTFGWTINKDVDKTEIDIADGGTATFNYTVDVTKDAGTDSGWKVNGTIQVFNPNKFDVSGVNVTDQINDGNATCEVTDGLNVTVLAEDTVSLSYECTYSVAPNPYAETNTATATWDQTTYETPSGSASFSFDFEFGIGPIPPNPTLVNDCVTVNDPLDSGSPRTFCSSDSFGYSFTTSGNAGTCTDYDNTATIVETEQSSSQTVKVCVGADLTVSKTAEPSFTRTYEWDISKAVDKTLVEKIGGGTATFNYTVNVNETGFTDSDWAVAGTITVTNPNDWEAITVDVVTDEVPGGDCGVTPLVIVVLPPGGSIEQPYKCTFAEQPPYNTDLTNTATATWDKDLYLTPTGSASGTAIFQFTTPTTLVNQTITVTDTFNGGTPTPLGTLTATDALPYASATYKYSHTVTVPTWNCKTYTNTAKIVETGQSVSQTVEVCGPAKTGALTMGYWQNSNGQGIIKNGASIAGVCKSGTWLRTYKPFQDLSATATCSQVATYVYNAIKAANASGASMNAMLKGQMLATALDVYFSDPALGGNKINAPAPIGGISIDLTKICKDLSCAAFENSSSVFGGSPKTVLEMLAYAASKSNVGGSIWYGNVKATQELAKDAFDALNNQKVFAP